MRLTKIKLAGFKSFVDPTTVAFPSNLTGVVGPNGCGKSNVIDAVRWVMGELSAKHLRGDSMADVIFNGSSARKPVGKASVELIFDNGDGKIAGPYAAYAEVALKREVLRDGSSSYLINGARCRRKDITQLFLGTGLGARSYAIIEQGMISRVIEAKSDEMRGFVEEAAGISRYKERRRETEARIADTRENLERLQDVRDEVEKQIRHLQRQAASARRYQALKLTERRLTGELLVLRLRELDSGAEVHDGAMRARDLSMQAALADLRSAEAAIETQRQFQMEQNELVSTAQARYYSVGADVSRTEQQIQYLRETRERQKTDYSQAQATLAELAGHFERDTQQIAALRAELARLAPEVERARTEEQAATERLAVTEAGLAEWQQAWETFNRELGSATQTTQVERARIEQLENQLRRLRGQSDRLAVERDNLLAQQGSTLLSDFAQKESVARSAADELSQALGQGLARVQSVRAEQLAEEQRLELARIERERVRAELLSIEALQKAALGRAEASDAAWLAAQGLHSHARIAETIEVDGGWERAVETVLGDYLEAVCVDGLGELARALEAFDGTLLSIFEASGAAISGRERTLAARVRAPAAISAMLASVQTADSLAEALAWRSELGPEQSVVTRRGEWVGRHWVRVRHGGDPHSGIIEREQSLKALRTEFSRAEQVTREIEARSAALREALEAAERDRDAVQTRIQSAHLAHADVLGQLEATRARLQESSSRRERLEAEMAEIARETGTTQDLLARAQSELERGLRSLDELDTRRRELDRQREERREAVTEARQIAQRAQATARDLLVRSEGRRSAEASVVVGLERMTEQRTQLAARSTELERALSSGDGPVMAITEQLRGFLERRADIEAELGAARRTLEEAESELRSLDEKRVEADRRVGEAREAMEQARLAAQETRVRRETIAEQFAATGLALDEVQQALPPDAAIEGHEIELGSTRSDIERLGPVNLAAIDELKENSDRKEYLDRQFADLNSALDTLEQAMRKIEKETRARFEETFERINAGLNDKFPRLFGGGHAYLELVGDDAFEAGVAIMARPPGKRNVTISQLSGGEKALTAVALVFSIFDLNPAPFCLLDEVDAPLDENNVGRFCDIVREMSNRVQFIFITHNKATMELASQLCGVTMNEPGVSRLVAVDVDEALRLAAS